jgi:hypothetical protein
MAGDSELITASIITAIALISTCISEVASSNLYHTSNYGILTGLPVFRIVFWDILQCKMIVDRRENLKPHRSSSLSSHLHVRTVSSCRPWHSPSASSPLMNIFTSHSTYTIETVTVSRRDSSVSNVTDYYLNDGS